MTDEGVSKLALAMLATAVASLAAVSVDASHRRALRSQDRLAIERVARELPTGDLALSGGARWLRFPSLEEPGAAFVEGPAMPDADPAGGIMAPPREVWAAELRR